MALFGRKKKEEEVPELEFGFPASKKRERVEGVTPITPVEPEDLEAPAMPELEPIEPIPGPPPVQEMAPPKLMESPTPIEIEEPSMPSGSRRPPIRAFRPHVFLKISKYKEVLNSIDEVMDHIKDLKKSLKSIHEVEEKEAIRIKESEDILTKLEEVARTFDRIFSAPEK